MSKVRLYDHATQTFRAQAPISLFPVDIIENAPPTADAGAGQSIQAGQPFTLSGSGTDGDGTIVSYAWVQASGTPVSLSSYTVVNPSGVAPLTTGTLTFRLTVTDDDGASDSSTVSINVSATPQPNTLVTDFGSLATGTALPGFTPRWASAPGDWEVVIDTGALSGRVLRCNRSTSARRLLTWDAADAMPGREKTQVCSLWKATTPTSSRIGMRLSGSTAATANGYVGGATDSSKKGITRYTSGAASTTNVASTFTAGSWYVTVVDDDGTAADSAGIRHKTWLFGTAEPDTWSPILSDSTTAPGWTGLFAFDAGGTTDFAYLSVGSGGAQAPRPQLPPGQVVVPTVDAGPGQTKAPSASFALAGVVNDPAGIVTGVAWMQDSGTATALTDATTLTPTGTAPPAATTLVYRLTATYTDGNGSPATVSDTVTIAVETPVVIQPSGSRGPDGTHWPAATPAPWSDNVAFTVGTIDEAVARLSQCSGGETIVVTGASQGNTSSLRTITGGSRAWPRNVLIRAATLGLKINGRYENRTVGTVFSGFEVTGEFKFVQADRSTLARTVWSSDAQFLLTSTRDCGVYEVVMPRYQTGGGDDMYRIGGSGGNGWVGSTRLSLVGVWCKPKLVPPTYDKYPHCDCAQTYSPNAPAVDTLWQDFVLFTGADKVFQSENHDVVRQVFRNGWMNSPATFTDAGQVPSTWKVQSTGQSVSGPGKDFLFEDVTILGTVNHKPPQPGNTYTNNSGTFRRVKIRGGDALTRNNPTLIDVVNSSSFNEENNPPPPLPTLSAIWGRD